AGEITANNIAEWNGSSWSALGSGLGGASPRVNALVVSRADLYVGGDFQTAGGNSANRVARWDGSGWSSLGSGMNDSVLALAVLGGELYAGGLFTAAGANPRAYI